MNSLESKQECIILIENEPQITKFYEKLKNKGYKIIPVFSIIEAINKIHNNNEEIDLILMDIDINNGTDLENTSRDLLKNKDIPLVFLISSIEKTVIEKIEKITAYGYIEKYSNTSAINSYIKMVFKLHNAKKELSKNEKIIYESEEKYRNIVENTVDVIYEVDSNGFFTYISPVIEYRYGFPKDEMIGKNFLEYIYMEDQPGVLETFSHILQGKIEPSEFRVQDKNGKMMYVRSSSRLIENRDGKYAVLGIMTDITAQKHAEQKLKATFQQMHDIIEFLPDPTFVIDQDRKVVSWNKAIEQLTGVKKEEIIEQGNYIYSTIFYNEHKPILIDLVGISDVEIEKKYNIIKRDGNSIYTEVFLPLLNQGKGAYLGCTAAPLFDASGERIGAIEVLHEITAYKQAEEKLKAALQQTHDIIEFLPDPAFVIDQDKKVVAWNRAIEQLTGIKKENILGKGNFEYALPFYNERRPILIDLTYLTYEEVEKEYEYIKLIDNTIYAETFISHFNQGKGIYLWGAAAPLFDILGNKIGAIEVIRNITDHKISEENLKKIIKEKETQIKEIQHRAKNNLNIISSLLQIEKDNITDKHSIRVFQNAIMRIQSISLIYDQLKIIPSQNKIDLKIYIEKTAELLFNTYSIGPGKINLKLNIEQTVINMNKAIYLGLILNELLSNSLKYAYNSDKEGELSIELSDNGKTVILSITDNGVGMNENIQVYLNKGLGLQLVKMITNQIGAKFILESYLGKGTSAKIMLDK